MDRRDRRDRRDIRVGDAERDEVTAALHEHFARGRLTREELDGRLTAALSAKTVGDLREITRDLPGEAEPRAVSPAGPAWPPDHRRPGWRPGPYGPGPAYWGRRPRWPGPPLGILFVGLILIAVFSGWWFIIPVTWATLAFSGAWRMRRRHRPVVHSR